MVFFVAQLLARGFTSIGTFSVEQLFKITSLIVRLSVLPTSPKNTNPFEGQGAQNDGMFLSLFDHSFVVDFGPNRIPHGLTRPFHKSLPQENWRLPPPMGPNLMAALLSHGRDSDKFLHAVGVGLEGTNRAKGHAEPWS